MQADGREKVVNFSSSEICIKVIIKLTIAHMLGEYGGEGVCQKYVGGAPSSLIPDTVLFVASAKADFKLLSVASSPTSQRTVAAVSALDNLPSRLRGYLCAVGFCA